MKTILINILTITLISALNVNADAQISNDSITHKNFQLNASQYLKKSHTQKVASMVLAIGGTTIGTIGMAMLLSSLNGFFDPGSQHKDYGSTPDILMIGGGALIVAAIPFQLASRANKMKAKLYMSKEPVSISSGIKTNTSFIAMNLKISFRAGFFIR